MNMIWNPQPEFMAIALEEAKISFNSQEVPVGAAVVYQGQVIATGCNSVESNQDASCHAELLALRKAAKIIGNWRLNQCTLYCTLEPCCMCFGAMIHFRLGQLVWGAPDLRHGALGSWYDLSLRSHPIHTIDWQGHFMEIECAKLLREFFYTRRQENKAKSKSSLPFSKVKNNVMSEWV
jgi:tRNA(adenine34) deaminase